MLRSRVLSHLYREARQGALSREEAREQLDRLTTMRVRLLGDRVSRAVAWKIAEQLDWDDTTNAEFVAVAKLQADAFVTLDEDLARQCGRYRHDRRRSRRSSIGEVPRVRPDTG